jgi:hypothetical protein
MFDAIRFLLRGVTTASGLRHGVKTAKATWLPPQSKGAFVPVTA